MKGSNKRSDDGGVSYYESPSHQTFPGSDAAAPDPQIDFHSSELASDGHLPSRVGFVGMFRQLVHSGKNAFEKDGPLEHSGSNPAWNEAGAVSFLSNEAYLTTPVMMSTTFSISFKVTVICVRQVLI